MRSIDTVIDCTARWNKSKCSTVQTLCYDELWSAQIHWKVVRLCIANATCSPHPMPNGCVTYNLLPESRKNGSPRILRGRTRASLLSLLRYKHKTFQIQVQLDATHSVFSVASRFRDALDASTGSMKRKPPG